MTTGKPAAQAPDANPKRATPKRVRCDNCPKFVLQYRPWQRFCSTRCRLQFHRNGGAFGSLKDKFPKWIADEVRRQVDAEREKLFAALVADCPSILKVGRAVRDMIEESKARHAAAAEHGKPEPEQ